MQLVYNYLFILSLIPFSSYAMEKNWNTENNDPEIVMAKKSSHLLELGLSNNESLYHYSYFSPEHNSSFNFRDPYNQTYYRQWHIHIKSITVSNISTEEVSHCQKILSKIHTYGKKNNLHNHSLYRLTKSLYEKPIWIYCNKEIVDYANYSLSNNEKSISRESHYDPLNNIRSFRFLLNLQQITDKTTGTHSIKKSKQLLVLYGNYPEGEGKFFLGKLIYFVRLCAAYNRSMPSNTI